MAGLFCASVPKGEKGVIFHIANNKFQHIRTDRLTSQSQTSVMSFTSVTQREMVPGQLLAWN